MTTSVSYIIAVYNKAKYLEECIDSILGEASPTIKIELCIVDDGSIDNSAEIIKKYNSYSCIKTEYFTKNLGKVAAYNKAFEMASGEYICIFGADDMVVTGRTEMMLRLAKENGNCIYGGYIKFTNSTEINSDNSCLPHNNISLEKISQTNLLPGGCILASRQILSSIFPIPSHLQFEDWWVAYNIVRINKLEVLMRPVTLYRISESNDVGSYAVTLQALQKDLKRHFACIDAFMKIARNHIEVKYLSDSSVIKRLWCNELVSFEEIFALNFGKQKIIAFMLYIFGSSFVFKSIALLRCR